MSADAPNANRACFTLAEVAAACGGALLNQGDHTPELTVTGIATDSRNVVPGSLFLALRGEKFDGHDYLVQAQAAGAIALVVERAWMEHHQPNLNVPVVAVADTLLALGAIAAAHRKRFDLPVIGITGSYGKTTTRALIAATLGAKFNVLSSAGNFNNEIGVPQTLLQLGPEHEVAVIEMGMRGAGQIAYLAGLAFPSVGVITNIGPQHIELLGSLEHIAAAKAELLQALPSDGLAVLPADDPSNELLRDATPCRVVSFGRNEAADYHASEIGTGSDGNIRFVVTQRSTGLGQTVVLPLPGGHNAVNAAAAIAVAAELSVPLIDAVRALENAAVPGARMKIVRASRWTIIDDCYNAGPNSMRAALETLRDFPGKGRKVAILGSMKELGDFAPGEHRKIGQFAATVASLIVGVGEEARVIADAAGGVETHWFPDAACAAGQVATLLEPGDVVLVKGSRSVGLELVVSGIGD